MNRVDDTLPFITKELVHREVVEDGIEDQRTQVLKEEKCTIRYLGTQVLEHYSYVVLVFITVVFETLLVVKDDWPLL